jgi:hypothetical protein
VFEDIDAQKSFDVSPDAPDRALLYVIWSRNEIGRVPVDRAWDVLASRYPKDARFLLFNAYEELVAPRDPRVWSPGYFLDKLQRILDAAGGRLNPEVRDLLAIAEDELHPLSEADAARLDRIRSRTSVRIPGDAEPAKKRLGRLAADVVRDLHEVTRGGKRIADASPELAGAEDWKAAMASATGAKKAYSATEKVSAGDVVEHPKFGAGVVVSVEPGRARILFESGARKLVCG